jgi:DNA-binding CsgD family transcriptional regulator
MQELVELSGLIAAIYDAAIDPAAWSAALGKANAFVRGAGAGIYAKDAVNKTGNLYFDDGAIARRYIHLYFEKYVKFDPSTTQHYFAGVDEPISTKDFIDYDEFVQTRFYKEWARPQGLVDHVSSVLERSSTSVALFGVFRNERQGLVDDEMRKRMRLIAPHVRRAVLISRLIDLKTAQATAWADTLDGIRAGVVLVDTAARIVQANGVGHALLTAGDVVHAREGRLSVTDVEAERAIRGAIAASAAGDASLGIGGISVSLRAPRQLPFVAHVLPLTSGSRRAAGAAHAAVAAIFIREAAFEMPSPPEVIAKTYGLTPMELRILIAIVDVGGVPAVAESLGMGATTVKTHLGRLFGKTGTRRQAELVKLVAGFASPLGSNSS